MRKHWLIAGAAAIALSAPAAADPWKDESGKRFEELKKLEEHRDKQREKAFEQRKKLIEERGKLAEQVWKEREKALEQRSKAIEKLAERRAKAREKRFERFERWDERFDDYGYYLPSRYRSLYVDDDDYSYRYLDDGYVYRVDRDDGALTALLPLLGGGFAVGQPLPLGYGVYNVPLQYRDVYYDTGDAYYRYGDRAIYRVDPATSLIQGVVALLTGTQLGVGSRLPMGYDVYNVPLGWRDRYYDRPDAWYRYADGYIYEVDPTTRLITAAIDAIA